MFTCPRTLVRRLSLLLILGGFVLAGSGCDFFGSEEAGQNIRELIDLNEQRWEERGIQNYQYSYDRRAPGITKKDVVVTVKEGAIESVTEDGEPVANPQDYLTMRAIFPLIREAYEREDRGNFNVGFSEEYNHPVRYFAGASGSTPSEWLTVRNFEVL